MTLTARLLALLAVGFFLGACGHLAPLKPTPRPPAADAPLPPNALQPSPNRLVGSVLAVDATRGFAFIGLTGEPPAAALTEGTELITRTADLRETARLRASRYVRSRTLGTNIISGQPTPGDEVVFRAP
jgi:hypothetical protein